MLRVCMIRVYCVKRKELYHNSMVVINYDDLLREE